ncbi:MAG: hypothetical protein RBR71_13860 [Gudongella sp.]|nr:hypothetical protein [Gudongella sp.]
MLVDGILYDVNDEYLQNGYEIQSLETEEIITQLEHIRADQITGINNSIEMVKIGFIVIGLVVALTLGGLFIRMVRN